MKTKMLMLAGWLATGGALAGVAGFLGACAIKEGSTDGGGGIVGSVTDSTKVNLKFDDTSKTVFTDSGNFNLVALRERLADKDIDPSTVRITGLAVTYDDSSKAFLEANKGLKYVLRIYVKEPSDTTAPKLALKSGGTSPNTSPLTLDPDQVLFELNKQIFGDSTGFSLLLSSIQDTSMARLLAIAELTLIDKLRRAGTLNLDMVVTVAGKI